MYVVLSHTDEDQRENSALPKSRNQREQGENLRSRFKGKKPRTSNLESWERKSATMRSETMTMGSRATTHFLRVLINHVMVRNRVSRFQSKSRTRCEFKSTMPPSEIGLVNLIVNHALAESPSRPCDGQKSGQ